MMSEYTPTTDNIQDAWTSRYDGQYPSASYDEYNEYKAEFDRWLASHESELREQIAKEIEALTWNFSNADSIQMIVMPQVRDRCAGIARGQK